MTEWPLDSTLRLAVPMTTPDTAVSLLGYNNQDGTTTIRWENDNGSSTTSSAAAGITIELPALTPDLIPCEHAWVLVLTGIGNLDQQVLSGRIQ